MPWQWIAVGVLGAAVLMLGAIVLAVELAMRRRFREIKAMFATALNVGASFDGAITALRKMDEDTSDRVSGLDGRVTKLEGEVSRLTAFHPHGSIPPHEERQ